MEWVISSINQVKSVGFKPDIRSAFFLMPITFSHAFRAFVTVCSSIWNIYCLQKEKYWIQKNIPTGMSLHRKLQQQLFQKWMQFCLLAFFTNLFWHNIRIIRRNCCLGFTHKINGICSYNTVLYITNFRTPLHMFQECRKQLRIKDVSTSRQSKIWSKQ